jgi:hypothetical protein
MKNVETDQARVKIAVLKAVIVTVVRYHHSIAIFSLSACKPGVNCGLPSGERESKLVLERRCHASIRPTLLRQTQDGEFRNTPKVYGEAPLTD